MDDGSHLNDFAEWAGHYKLKLKREATLEKLSRQRLKQLQRQAGGGTIELAPHTFDDLLSAAESSLDFWDNPFDDEDWNDA